MWFVIMLKKVLMRTLETVSKSQFLTIYVSEGMHESVRLSARRNAHSRWRIIVEIAALSFVASPQLLVDIHVCCRLRSSFLVAFVVLCLVVPVASLACGIVTILVREEPQWCTIYVFGVFGCFCWCSKNTPLTCVSCATVSHFFIVIFCEPV